MFLNKNATFPSYTDYIFIVITITNIYNNNNNNVIIINIIRFVILKPLKVKPFGQTVVVFNIPYPFGFQFIGLCAFN